MPTIDKITAMGLNLVEELYAEIKVKIQANEDQIDRINKVRPKSRLKRLAPFKLSQKTIKILQNLDGNPCTLNWELNIKNSKYDTKILKIWYSLHKKNCKNQKWTQWPEILVDVAFRNNALEDLGIVIESLDSYIFTRV